MLHTISHTGKPVALVLLYNDTKSNGLEKTKIKMHSKNFKTKRSPRLRLLCSKILADRFTSRASSSLHAAAKSSTAAWSSWNAFLAWCLKIKLNSSEVRSLELAEEYIVIHYVLPGKSYKPIRHFLKSYNPYDIFLNQSCMICCTTIFALSLPRKRKICLSGTSWVSGGNL